MHAVGSQTWIILACLAFMSHWCKHIGCESIVPETDNGLEQTIAENKISDGRNGLVCNRSRLAQTITSHREINENKHTKRSVNHECGKRPLMERQLRDRNEFEDRQVAPPPKLDKILGGMNAVKGANPWQVGLRTVYKKFGDNFTFHFCGGTILSEYWILSVAHCFISKAANSGSGSPSLSSTSNNKTRMTSAQHPDEHTVQIALESAIICMRVSKDDFVVRIGDHNNEVFDDYEQEFKIDVLITHEKYDAMTEDYDIALIKIRPQNGRGIVFNDYVQPACLPKNNTEYEAGMKCHISGWGRTGNGSNPNILQAAVVPIISDSECNRVYEGQITPQMFCAGYLPEGANSCPGDSGGPFVCDIQGKYTVLGATSWVDACAAPNKPGVYANVKVFLPWIKETILQETPCLVKLVSQCDFFEYYSTLFLLQHL